MNEGVLIAPNVVGALSSVMGQIEVFFFVAAFKCVPKPLRLLVD